MVKFALSSLAVLALVFCACSLFFVDFPAELQGRWEFEDQFYYEWFVIEGSELYYCRHRISGSNVDERTMNLLEIDQATGRFRTTDLFFLYRWEGEALSFAYAEDDYPSVPEWKDVDPY